MENYYLKLTSNIIAGFLIAMGILIFLPSCILLFVYDELLVLFVTILLFSIPFLIWGFVIKGRKFMCNNERFEAVGCVEEVQNGYEEIKVKIPMLTLRWDSIKSYSYKAGFAGGYIIVNTLDDKKYHIKAAYMIPTKSVTESGGYRAILEQFESRFETTNTVTEQVKKQHIWGIVAIIIAILLLILRSL